MLPKYIRMLSVTLAVSLSYNGSPLISMRHTSISVFVSGSGSIMTSEALDSSTSDARYVKFRESVSQRISGP